MSVRIPCPCPAEIHKPERAAEARGGGAQAHVPAED